MAGRIAAPHGAVEPAPLGSCVTLSALALLVRFRRIARCLETVGHAVLFVLALRFIVIGGLGDQAPLWIDDLTLGAMQCLFGVLLPTVAFACVHRSVWLSRLLFARAPARGTAALASIPT